MWLGVCWLLLFRFVVVEFVDFWVVVLVIGLVCWCCLLLVFRVLLYGVGVVVCVVIVVVVVVDRCWCVVVVCFVFVVWW